MFKFLEKPLVPIGSGPVYFQQRKFIFPGRKHFINKKENMFFFLFDMYNLNRLMITIRACYIFAVCFTFIDQQRTTNSTDETDGRDD